ncbi:MAG: lipopolysaccharide biosynthesis protein [Nitrosotalea sp.]
MTFRDKIRNIVLANKALSTLGASNALSSIVLAFFWFLVAAIVDTNNYGKISYYIAIASIVTTFATPGVANTLMVHGSKNPKIKSPLFLISIILVLVSSTILFFVIHNFATSLYLLGYATFAVITSELLSRQLFGELFKITIIQRILSIAISLSLYYFIGLDGIILGLAVSYLIYIPKFIVVLKQEAFDVSVLKNYKGFMITNYGYDISRILATQLDKLVIFPLFGFMILGNYYLANQFLAVGIIIPGTVYQYLLPQESKEKSFKTLKIATIVTSVFIVISIIALAPLLFPILFSHFVDAIKMVQIMILSLIPQTINLMYITKFLTKGSSRVVLVGSIIFIIIQIISIIVLGKIMGIYGIALALLLAHTTESAYLVVCNRYFDDKK